MALKNIYFDTWEEYVSFVEKQNAILRQKKKWDKAMNESLDVSDQLYEEYKDNIQEKVLHQVVNNPESFALKK